MLFDENQTISHARQQNRWCCDDFLGYRFASRKTAMKQLRHRYSPTRRGGRAARARQGEALIEDPRNASPVGRSVKRSAGVVSSAERFAGLTTPSAPDGASTPPLRGGVDRNREVELKAELRRV